MCRGDDVDCIDPLNDHTKRKLLPIERVCSVWNPLFAKCGPMAKHGEFITFRQQWAQETEHLLKRQWKKKRRKQMQRISDPWSLERPHVECVGKSNASQRPKVREPRHTPSPSPESEPFIDAILCNTDHRVKALQLDQFRTPQS